MVDQRVPERPGAEYKLYGCDEPRCDEPKRLATEPPECPAHKRLMTEVPQPSSES